MIALSHVHYIPSLDNGKYVTITDIEEADVGVDTTGMGKQHNLILIYQVWRYPRSICTTY